MDYVELLDKYPPRRSLNRREIQRLNINFACVCNTEKVIAGLRPNRKVLGFLMKSTAGSLDKI